MDYIAFNTSKYIYERETSIYRFRVNPVSGYVEPPRPSPFAGMSDEQKEYEAMKLADLIGRLHSMGIVKPGKLGKSFGINY